MLLLRRLAEALWEQFWELSFESVMILLTLYHPNDMLVCLSSLVVGRNCHPIANSALATFQETERLTTGPAETRQNSKILDVHDMNAVVFAA